MEARSCRQGDTGEDSAGRSVVRLARRVEARYGCALGAVGGAGYNVPLVGSLGGGSSPLWS